MHPRADSNGPGEDSMLDLGSRTLDRGSRIVEPVPPPADATKPRRGRKAEDPERTKNAGDIVAAFVEGALASGQDEPPTSIKARVGRDARQLLAQGKDAEALIASARRMGMGEWNDLAVQVRKDGAAAANGRASPGADSTGAERAQQAMTAGLEVQAMIDEGKFAP